MHLVCTLGLFLTLLHLSDSLLLGAFNIRSFGDTKASNATLMNIITKIVQRYDVILIQEVRDADLSATQTLMEYVNKDSPQYKHIVSEPLGASTYKERYLFLYSAKSQQESPQGALYCQVDPNTYREKPNNHMTPYEQHFGDSGKEKLPFNRKKPPAEPGSGRGGYL